ncbi:MAG: glutamine cyclotransferase [Kordia sp.]|nr:MAG: glutamine cyclotransferase [Kordia sp.]
MKPFNLLAIIILSVLFISCTEEEKDVNKLFSIETSNNTTKYPLGERVTFAIHNKKDHEIGSISYHINNIKIDGNQYLFNSGKLGVKTIKATFTYNDDIVILKKNIEILSNQKTKVLTFEIINEYPHDINAYTQGLEFYKGELYESTGQRGKSSLRKVDYKTGEVLRKIDLDPKYFGEGLTFLNDDLYQLTWQSKVGFIYNPEDFSKTKTFKYTKSNEGWGICNDGKTLYKSDGTEKIWTLNPTTLEEEDYIQIYSNTSKIKSVNELEWINGKIYANIYQQNGIAIINPENGAVEAVVNCNSLKKKVTQHADLDVLNGIAYNPETQTIFVTGKNWDKLFEIKIVN